MNPWDAATMLSWAKAAFEEWNIEPFNNPSLSAYLSAYAESPTVIGTENLAIENLGYVLKLMRLCELSAKYSTHYQAAFHEDIVQYFMEMYKEPWIVFSTCITKPGTFFPERVSIDSGKVYAYLTNKADIAVTKDNADAIYWYLLLVVFCARMFEVAHETRSQTPNDDVSKWLSVLGNAFERSVVARCVVALGHTYQLWKFIEKGGLDGKFDGSTLNLIAKPDYRKGMAVVDFVSDTKSLRQHLVDTYKGTELATAFSTVPDPRLYRTMFTNYRENIRVFTNLKKQKYVELMGLNLYWVLMCNNFAFNLHDLCSVALLVDECLKLPKTTSHGLTMFCVWLLTNLIPAWSRVLATNLDGGVARSSHDQIKGLISDVLEKTKLSGQDDGNVDSLTQQAWAIVDTLGAGEQAKDFESFVKMNQVSSQAAIGGKLDAKLLSNKEENWGTLKPNSVVRKTFRFQNTGSVTWPPHFVLGFVGNNYRLAGAYGDADTLVQVTGVMAKEPVEPGKIVDISVDIRVPNADPVGYYGNLGFRGPDGPFGDRIKISFVSGNPEAAKQSAITAQQKSQNSQQIPNSKQSTVQIPVEPQQYQSTQKKTQTSQQTSGAKQSVAVPDVDIATEAQQILEEAQQVAVVTQQMADYVQEKAKQVDTKEAQQVAKQAQQKADAAQELVEEAKQVSEEVKQVAAIVVEENQPQQIDDADDDFFKLSARAILLRLADLGIVSVYNPDGTVEEFPGMIFETMPLNVREAVDKMGNK